jgi:transposase InsO family protein
MKYAWIARHCRRWSVSLVCDVLKVSISGYYAYCRRGQAGARAGSWRLGDEALLVHIRVVHGQTHGEYGWPRVWRTLRARGLPVGKERVRKLMQRHGIRARGKRKFKVTTDSNHALPVSRNLVSREFSVAQPNRVWSGDITYIDTGEGWLYLAVVIDLFSRQVVGWSMKPHMKSELVLDALCMAWFRRRPEAGLIFHSDRGRQYCGYEFQRVLSDYEMHSSMSRRGDCWDNAPTESFWGSLKVGRLYGCRFQTHREAMDEVLDWLNFYNRNRLHSTLGYVSPMQFEKTWRDDQAKRAA